MEWLYEIIKVIVRGIIVVAAIDAIVIFLCIIILLMAWLYAKFKNNKSK